MYIAPVADLIATLECLGFWDDPSAVDRETVSAILEAAGTFGSETLAPLNAIGDRQGSRLENGVVSTPEGFREAYQKFAQGGWTSLSADHDLGGQALGHAIELAVFEIFHSANMAFALCPTLSLGAIAALSAAGTPAQRASVLPRLVSGEWTGTMNLTEPQAGSDLARIAARAEPKPDGTFAVSGQKIFITWGDHDLTDNVVHLVLARLPNAPQGIRGISLFLVPKWLEHDLSGERRLNGVSAMSLEDKLGIHASPTCVMSFDAAVGELVGNEHEGIPNMFLMMNAARLQVGIQGVAIAERSFQGALNYAAERVQGKIAWASDEAGAQTIFGHPDVRRSLVLMKARIQASRAICLMAGIEADKSQTAPSSDLRNAAKRRHDLLTPIAKSWSTDIGVEVSSEALQVYGGMGFIEETGAAQHYRDARIAPIYEGTNAIQAIDLVSRKVALDEGAAMRSLITDLRQVAYNMSEQTTTKHIGPILNRALNALDVATSWVVANPGPPSLMAASSYMKLAGEVLGGALLGKRIRLVSTTGDASAAELIIAETYFTQILSAAPSHLTVIEAGFGELDKLKLHQLAS